MQRFNLSVMNVKTEKKTLEVNKFFLINMSSNMIKTEINKNEHSIYRHISASYDQRLRNQHVNKKR